MDINYYILLSTLIGTIVGGLITWLVTKDSLNKQFKEQDKRYDMKERKKEVVALNAILKEMDHNIIQFEATRKIMVSKNLDFIDYKISNLHNNYSMEKWNNHGDVILFIEDLDCLSRLQAFYINLSFEINNQLTDRKRNEKLITSGLSIIKELERYIDSYRKQLTI